VTAVSAGNGRLAAPVAWPRGRGRGVGDGPLAWHGWIAPGSGVTGRSQMCVGPQVNTGG